MDLENYEMPNAEAIEKFVGAKLDDIVTDDSVKPPEAVEKVPGLSDYKNYMRQFFTVRRQRVVECGHKYNEMVQPRTNCEHCWFAFLNTHGDMVKIADEIFVKENGRELLTRLQGAKFVKMFTRFMSTIARWKAENDAKGLNDGTESAAGKSGQQGEPVQEPTGVGEDSQRKTEDNDIASPVGG